MDAPSGEGDAFDISGLFWAPITQTYLLTCSKAGWLAHTIQFYNVYSLNQNFGEMYGIWLHEMKFAMG